MKVGLTSAVQVGGKKINVSLSQISLRISDLQNIMSSIPLSPPLEALRIITAQLEPFLCLWQHRRHQMR